MPGTLSFLDSLSKTEIEDWLHRALLGKENLPRSYPDEGVCSIIMGAEAELDRITRQDLAAAVVKFVHKIKSRSSLNDEYVSGLMGLVKELKLTDIIHTLLELAKAIIEKKKIPLTYAGKTTLFYTILNLPMPQSEDFWVQVWESNPSHFAGVAITGLQDLDPIDNLHYLSKLPNSQDIADTVAINLDYYADHMSAANRSRFKDKLTELSSTSSSCPAKIQHAIHSWLREAAAASPLGKALQNSGQPIELATASLVAA